MNWTKSNIFVPLINHMDNGWLNNKVEKVLTAKWNFYTKIL